MNNRENVEIKEKTYLLASSQGIVNRSRLIFCGSFRMFNNKYINDSKGDNLIFFNNII